MTFKLTCEMDNEAFSYDSAAEVARILRDVADMIETTLDLAHALHDINGNTVGHTKTTGRRLIEREDK